MHLLSIGLLRSCRIEHLGGVAIRDESAQALGAALLGETSVETGTAESGRKEQPNADFVVH